MSNQIEQIASIDNGRGARYTPVEKLHTNDNTKVNIWKVKDPLNQICILKEYPPHINHRASDESYIYGILAQTNVSMYVPQVYDVFDIDGFRYILMSYMGEQFSYNWIDGIETLNWFHHYAYALDGCHAANVFHLDLQLHHLTFKNIENTAVPSIIDFGSSIVCAQNSAPHITLLPFSPVYSSSIVTDLYDKLSQVHSEMSVLDLQKIDLFAFGVCVLIAMHTGYGRDFVPKVLPTSHQEQIVTTYFGGLFQPPSNKSQKRKVFIPVPALPRFRKVFKPSTTLASHHKILFTPEVNEVFSDFFNESWPLSAVMFIERLQYAVKKAS